MTAPSWDNCRVLVTGGAGFVGSHVVEWLVEHKADVTVLDALPNPQRLAHLQGQFTYVQTDLSQPALGSWAEKGFEQVLHLAAYSQLTKAQDNAELAYRQNVIGTVNMLQWAKQWQVKKFIFSSAGGLYTNIPKYLPIDERHPIDPSQGVYVMTKRIGELLCEEFRAQYGLPTLIFRLFNAYGPQQSNDFLIPTLIQQAIEKGCITVRNRQVKRDFTFVKDTVRLLLLGAESEVCGGPFNIGTGVEHSLFSVAEKIAALTNARVECLDQPVFGPMRQLCDSRLAQQTFAWKPTVSLEEGLRMTVGSRPQAEVLRS
ncbi:MAG: NAD-dependent epimerase/dehydratase family protein [Candidatus Omnitrophica bacterium]|nr:NAD-dependent epimerase/dehydratase family protein [Candidatus Omnitrophota bacterium]